MPFSIQIKLATTLLLMQQNTACTLIIRNLEDSPAEALHPNLNPWSLTFRVTDVKTGIETLYRPDRTPFDQENLIAFGPRQTDESVVPLLMKASFPAPGEYEISAIWVWGPGKPAESNILRVKVSPFTPRNLALFRPDFPVFRATVLNADQDPPMLLCAQIRLMPGGGFDRLVPVAPVNLRTTAVLSDGPNQSIVPGEWIAWLDGKQLKAAHLSPNEGLSQIFASDVPEEDCQLIGPAFSETPPDSGRPPGAVLALSSKTTSASVRVFKLTPSGIQPGPSATIPSVPVWISSCALADNRRFFVFCAPQGPKLGLFCSSWPGTGAGALVKLAEWPRAEFAGATLSMDADDNLRGGVLMWNKSSVKPALELIVFKAVPTGKFEELTRRPVGHDYDAGISRAVVRVFQSGFFAVLIKNNAGQWALWDPIHGENKLIAPLDKTPLPLDLAMIRSDDPILLSGTIGAGIKFLRPDGSSLKFNPK